MQKLRTYFSSFRSKLSNTIDSHPLFSFFGLLALIILVIVIGNFLRKPAPVTSEVKKPSREVQLFSIGKAPKIAFSGKVEKTGAIKIVSQTSGVVQNIQLQEGSKVWRGQSIVSLSSNYQGGNIASLSRQIAEKNAKMTDENYPDQMALIARQKEAAEQADINADQLRSISTSSLQATQDLIALNQELVNTLDANIAFLQSSNNTGTPAETAVSLLQAKQAKSGIESGLISLKTALANGQYQSTAGNPPEKLSDLSKDIALGQLNLQQKSLDLSKEISQLNLQIARISESFMYPASPCAGVIERVNVNVGQLINPGQTIASISCAKTAANISVLVSGDVARQLSRIEPSTITVAGKTVDLMPRYISTEPTDGTLHSVVYTLPESMESLVHNGSSVSVQLPVCGVQSTSSVPYIPIDAVFQTQSASTIYVATQSAEGKWLAEGRDITLGNVFGSYVEVQKGISATDQVILNRDVVAGDEVTFH